MFYYQLMLVSENRRELDREFRRLALRYHPDKNKDPRAKEQFQELIAEYEQSVLKCIPETVKKNTKKKRVNWNHYFHWNRTDTGYDLTSMDGETVLFVEDMELESIVLDSIYQYPVVTQHRIKLNKILQSFVNQYVS